MDIFLSFPLTVSPCYLPQPLSFHRGRSPLQKSKLMRGAALKIDSWLSLSKFTSVRSINLFRASAQSAAVSLFIKLNNGSDATEFITGNQKRILRAHLIHFHY